MEIMKCKERARDTFYWSGMAKKTEEEIAKCATCNTFRNNNLKEPHVRHLVPKRAWAKAFIDLLQFCDAD